MEIKTVTNTGLSWDDLVKPKLTTTLSAAGTGTAAAADAGTTGVASPAYTALMGTGTTSTETAASETTNPDTTELGDSGLIAMPQNYEDTWTGGLTYDAETGIHGNTITGEYWKYGENGETIYVDENGNEIGSEDTSSTDTASSSEDTLSTGTESAGTTTTEESTSTSDTPYTSQEDAINAQYDALIEAAKLNIEKSLQQSISQYEQELADALPEYQKQREQQDLLTKQNEQKIKEYAFYTGDTGGMSRQDALQNWNSGQEIIGDINLQEQKLKNDTQQAIIDLILQGNIDAALAEAEYAAQRTEALANERIRLQESNAAWEQWITEETGYMPDGTKTMDRQALEYDMGISDTTTSDSSGSSALTSYLTKYSTTSGTTSGTSTGTTSTGTSGSSSGTTTTTTTDTTESTENPYAPTANSTQVHAQYYQDEKGNWVWQPYYTSDAYKTTPADYTAPSDTDDVVNWIINSAASYSTSDGAEVNSPINDYMKFNNIMSYIGANYNKLSDTDKARLLSYYGLSASDMLAYFKH